jgi:hypothetical protein
MFCPNCGTGNQDNAQFCMKCGNQLAAQPIQPAGPPAATVPLAPGEAPPEIKGFNFGAFALNFIWAFAHNLTGWGVAILIIGIIPVVQIIDIGFAIYLGIKGTELAWKKRRFESIQQFKDTQRVWTIAGVIVFCTFIPVSFFIASITAAIAIPNFMLSKNKAHFANCMSELTNVRTAEEMYISDNSVYTDDMGKLTMYILPGCTDPKGADCKGKMKEKLDGSCLPGSVTIEIIDNGLDYLITGTANDRRKCRIEVSPTETKPLSYSECRSTGYSGD